MMPAYTVNGTLSASETPVYAGTCMINVGSNVWIRWTSTNSSNNQGRQIGVAITQGMPGGNFQLITVGQVPWSLFNCGPGAASLVQAAAGSPQRGNTGDQLGCCDTSGALCLYASFCGIKLAPSQVSLVATGSGVLHCTSGNVDAAASLGTSDQLLVTNHAGTDTTWVTLSGDGTIASGVLTVTGIQGKAVSSAAPSSGQILIFGTNWTPTTVGGDATLSASGGALTVVSLSGSSGTTSLKSNLNPSADNTYGIGTSALRLTAVSALSYKVYNAASDAQPSVNITTQQIALGVGGSTATDVRLRRSAATTLTLDDTAGNSINVVPPSNNAGALGTSLLSWGNVAAQFVSCFHAAGDANPTLLLADNSIKFGAGGASSQDTRLKRTSASNLQLDDGNNGGAVLTNPAGFTINAGTQLNLDINGSPAIIINSTLITAYDSIYPASDALQSLGSTSARWNAFINTLSVTYIGGISGQNAPMKYAVATISTLSHGGTTTLTAAQYACPVIVLKDTGLTSSTTVVVPNAQTVYFFDTSGVTIGSQTLTIETSSPGTTVVRSAAGTNNPFFLVYCDGANNCRSIN